MNSLKVPVAICLILFSAALCHGAEFEEGEIIEVSFPLGNDLYVAGSRVVVSEPVTGDLVAAGGSLIVNGPVGEDLQIAGGSLLVNAPVADDLRAAGGDVVLSSSVGGDVLVLGGNVTIPAGAVVEGNVVVGAGNLYMGGIVKGDLLVQAGSLDLTGTVQGNAKLLATDRINLDGRIQGNAVFTGTRAQLGPRARFDRDVTYWREAGEMDFTRVPVGGQARFEPELQGSRGMYPSHDQKRRALRGLGGLFFGTLLSGIAVILLSILLLKGTFRQAGEALHRSYWKSTGVGFLMLALLPLAGLLALVTLIGIPVGMLFLVVFAFSLIFGRVIAAMAFAAWMERRRVAEWSTGRLMLTSIGFYVAMKLVSLLPFIGWFVVLLAVLAGYGALVTGLWRGKTA
jgi:cytoskeletal protein CcmA (bactofilin family)